MREKLYRIEQPKIPVNWEAESKKLTDSQKSDLVHALEIVESRRAGKNVFYTLKKRNGS